MRLSLGRLGRASPPLLVVLGKIFGKSNVSRKGEMLPVFRLDLFRGVLSILPCVFRVRYGVSLAMNFREFFRRSVNFRLVFLLLIAGKNVSLFFRLLLREFFLSNSFLFRVG